MFEISLTIIWFSVTFNLESEGVHTQISVNTTSRHAYNAALYSRKFLCKLLVFNEPNSSEESTNNRQYSDTEYLLIKHALL
jgi:hypothetical protein